MQTTIPSKTVVWKLRNFELSPNGYLCNEDRVVILRYLLGQQLIRDGLEALQYVFSTPYELPEETEEIESSFGIGNHQLKHYSSLTIDLSTKEASGRTLMGLVLLELTSAIHKQESRLELNVDHEYSLFHTRRSGPDYAADVAVIVVNIVSTAFISLLLFIDLFIFPQDEIRRPVILYEYKPQVPLSHKDIDLSHICEVLIQGYYCVKHFTPVLHCLTDLSDLHYFMLEYEEAEDSLKIRWTHSFNAENLSQEHLKFLNGAVKPFDSIAIKYSFVHVMSTS